MFTVLPEHVRAGGMVAFSSSLILLLHQVPKLDTFLATITLSKWLGWFFIIICDAVKPIDVIILPTPLNKSWQALCVAAYVF